MTRRESPLAKGLASICISGGILAVAAAAGALFGVLPVYGWALIVAFMVGVVWLMRD